MILFLEETDFSSAIRGTVEFWEGNFRVYFVCKSKIRWLLTENYQIIYRPVSFFSPNTKDLNRKLKKKKKRIRFSIDFMVYLHFHRKNPTVK